MYKLSFYKNKIISPWLLLALLTLSVPSIAEQTRYVTDILYVPLRSGGGNEYRIINSRIRSGAVMTVLSGADSDEWIQVRTEDGMEGWIRSQYLSAEQTGRMQLAQQQNKLAKLEKENTELKKANKTLRTQNAALNKNATSASSENSTLTDELQKIKALSADAINLEQRYRELLEKHKMLETTHETITVENDKLKSDKNLNFMFYGAGLMLAGVILTLLLPAIRPKKRYSEWR